MRIKITFASFFLSMIFSLLMQEAFAGNPIQAGDSSEINRKRMTGLIAGGVLLYGGSMTGLYHLWYKDFTRDKFHFINDNDEWLQMDKAGHSVTAYYVGYLGYEAMRWAGTCNTKAAWYGGSLGFAYLTVIEILDGFSAGWGASGGDLIANGLGSAAFISQQLVWNEQRILLKWSFHPTDHAQYRPSLLGNTIAERAIKDYNGQTVWLSANIHSFLQRDSKFPSWLNVAFGYGADGMTGARSNPEFFEGNALPHFERRRQFYLAPDIDLTRIRTSSPFLNKIFKTTGFLKIPLPAVEFSKKGVKFHPLYF
ncbi:MAG TPA: DUF2279 domain-containing protein [Lentimicrobium sp.]|nr:DUF2279 domain-containing protein [Lentimicrobium sp.]